MRIYADILLLSREPDGWLSLLSNNTLKQIAEYFFAPDYEEYNTNYDEWWMISQMLREYENRHYCEMVDKMIKHIMPEETIEETVQRALDRDSWMKMRREDCGGCWPAEHDDCDCNHDSDSETVNNLKKYRLIGTNFEVCEYFYQELMKEMGDDESFEGCKNSLKSYLEKYRKEKEWIEAWIK